MFHQSASPCNPCCGTTATKSPPPSEGARQSLQPQPRGANHSIDGHAERCRNVETGGEAGRIEQQLYQAAQAVQHGAAPEPAMHVSKKPAGLSLVVTPCSGTFEQVTPGDVF